MEKELKEMIDTIINNQKIIYRKLMQISDRQFDIPELINKIVNEKQSVVKVLEKCSSETDILYLDVFQEIEIQNIEMKKEIEEIKRIESE